MRFSKLKEISGHAAGIYSLAFDGEFLYSASADQYIARWNLATGFKASIILIKNYTQC